MTPDDAPDDAGLTAEITSGFTPRELDVVRRAAVQVGSALDVADGDVARGVARLQHAITTETQSHTATTTRHPRHVARHLAAIVLAALAIVGVGIGISTRKPSNGPPHSYATRAGEWRTVTLSDGSRVVLAPRTTLVIAAGFGHDIRSVRLDGEATFQVTSGTKPPFVVQSGLVETRVLGTDFEVTHYPTDGNVQIAVSTGKVSIERVRAGVRHPSTRTHVTTLVAGRVARITDSSAVVTESGDGPTPIRWLQGKLVFAGAPMVDALTAIGHWYGYQFRLADTTLAQQHVTATLTPGSPTDMLNALRIAFDVTMTFDGDVVTIHPRTTSTLPRHERRDVRDSNLLSPSRTEVGR